jgi:hypothetical protein
MSRSVDGPAPWSWLIFTGQGITYTVSIALEGVATVRSRGFGHAALGLHRLPAPNGPGTLGVHVRCRAQSQAWSVIGGAVQRTARHGSPAGLRTEVLLSLYLKSRAEGPQLPGGAAACGHGRKVIDGKDTRSEGWTAVLCRKREAHDVHTT